ncbi:hypothetical protein SARC_02983 [Sphaeroforma arctica JP610]|uniref:RRM domain-containing protein n=1 Tax=Sphaeroforma arctica JP610 TaxID=667725 RepID=A0A0L0G976_9EUKA|nr:hypothetical protein SARC_02983 [Sphaeroforma arctica JP610]KNC84808.1 hypothetical protein SARC_02983 [Sphaeroforma arctica JP610]|eukprot:XP_014158710.1 hypothetical protein SARC_02983 [Sphaeroforma arctica JP610]
MEAVETINEDSDASLNSITMRKTPQSPPDSGICTPINMVENMNIDLNILSTVNSIGMLSSNDMYMQNSLALDADHIQMSDMLKVGDDVFAQYGKFDYDLFNQSNALFDGPASWELPAHIPDLDSLLAMEPTLNALPFMDISGTSLASPTLALSPTPALSLGMSPTADFFGHVWPTAFTPDMPGSATANTGILPGLGLGLGAIGTMGSLSDTESVGLTLSLADFPLLPTTVEAATGLASNPVSDVPLTLNNEVMQLTPLEAKDETNVADECMADVAIQRTFDAVTNESKQLTKISSMANMFPETAEAPSTVNATTKNDTATTTVQSAANDAAGTEPAPLQQLNTAELIEQGMSKDLKDPASKGGEGASNLTLSKSSKPDTPTVPDKKRISLANYTRRKITTVTPTPPCPNRSTTASTKAPQVSSDATQLTGDAPVGGSATEQKPVVTCTVSSRIDTATTDAKESSGVALTSAVSDKSTEAESKRLVQKAEQPLSNPQSKSSPKEDVRTAGTLLSDDTRAIDTGKHTTSGRGVPTHTSDTAKSVVKISKDAKPARTHPTTLASQTPLQVLPTAAGQTKPTSIGALGEDATKRVKPLTKGAVKTKFSSRVASVFADSEADADTQASDSAVGNLGSLLQRNSGAKGIKIGAITGTGTAICKRKAMLPKTLTTLTLTNTKISQKRTISDASLCSLSSATTVQSDPDEDSPKRVRTHTSESVTTSASISSASGTERSYSESGSDTERSPPSRASSPYAKRVNSRAATASPAAVSCTDATPTSPKRVGRDTSVSSDHIAWFNSVVRTRHSSPPPARTNRFDRFSNHGNRPSPLPPPHYAPHQQAPQPFRREPGHDEKFAIGGPREEGRFSPADARGQAFGPMYGSTHPHERKNGKNGERAGMGMDGPYRDERDGDRERMGAAFMHPSHRWQNDTQLQHQDSMYHRQQLQHQQACRPHPNMPHVGGPLMGPYPEQGRGMSLEHPRGRPHSHAHAHTPDGVLKREPEPFFHERVDDFRRHDDVGRRGQVHQIESPPHFDRERDEYARRSRDRGRSEHRSDRREYSRERSSSRRHRQSHSSGGKGGIDSEEEHRLRTVFVGDVSPDLRESDIRRMFGAHGPVENMRLFLERHYFFVTYKSQHGADVAIDEMNGFLLKDGNRLRVSRGGRRAFLKQAWQDSDRTYDEGEDGEGDSFDDELRRLLR